MCGPIALALPYQNRKHVDSPQKCNIIQWRTCLYLWCHWRIARLARIRPVPSRDSKKHFIGDRHFIATECTDLDRTSSQTNSYSSLERVNSWVQRQMGTLLKAHHNAGFFSIGRGQWPASLRSRCIWHLPVP